MKKQTFEQVLDFANKHQRTRNLREWANISAERQQETDNYLQKETGVDFGSNSQGRITTFS